MLSVFGSLMFVVILVNMLWLLLMLLLVVGKL